MVDIDEVANIIAQELGQKVQPPKLLRGKRERKKKQEEGCENCQNRHMPDHYCFGKQEGGYKKYLKIKIIEEREQANRLFINECTHKSHFDCTNSECCELFFHEGDCLWAQTIGSGDLM